MKKKLLFGFSAALLAACSVTDTDEGKSEVLRFEDLPRCSTEADVSGANYLGTKLYVEDDDAYYLCTKDGWILSDSLPVESNAGSSDYVIDSATVTGKAAPGGAFEFGSPILLKELKLDAKKKELLATGVSFTDEISSSKGDFVISNVSLNNRYALIEVTGLYYDMKTGNLSEDSLTLRALVNLEKADSIAVNVLTHIEFARIQKLVSKGYSVEAAKIQAEKEIFTALGFGGTVEDADAAILALSILLRNTEDESSFADALDAFSKSVAENGVWDDSEAMTLFGDFAYKLETLKFRDEESENVNLRTSDYRKHLESFGVGNVPDFESYLTKFWNFAYGLGDCGAARQHVVLQNRNENSDSASAYFTCESNVWRTASDFERDTVNLGDARDGELKEGNVRDSITYAYDSTGTGTGAPTRWVEADSIVLVIGESCTDDEEGTKGKFLKTKDEDEKTNYYACMRRQWTSIDKYTFEIGYLCEESLSGTVEKATVDETTTYWRCAETAGIWNWKNITKAEYNTNGKECNPSKLLKVGETIYVCSVKAKDNEEKIDKWREATELENSLNATCTQYNANEIFKYDSKYYRCTNPYKMGYAWNTATEADWKTKDKTCGINEMSSFTTVEKNEYVCTDSINVSWRLATENEKLIGKVCSASNIGSELSNGSDDYQCGCPDYMNPITSSTEVYYPAITDLATCEASHLSLDWLKKAP